MTIRDAKSEAIVDVMDNGRSLEFSRTVPPGFVFTVDKDELLELLGHDECMEDDDADDM